MLYSSISKVGHILRNYNLLEFNHDYTIFGFRCLLKNLHSDLTTVLDVNYPAYNILYPLRQLTAPEGYQVSGYYANMPLIYDDNINTITANKARSRSIFNRDYETMAKTYDTFITDYIKTPYYQRHKTIRNNTSGDFVYSNEYMTHYIKSDITSIQKSLGILDVNVKEIVGKFYIDDNDDVRLVINPENVILSNVDKIFVSNFYLHYKNGNNYPQFFFIYTTKDDVNNVKLFYYNSIIESIVPNSTRDISLTSIFSEYQPTIRTDIENDTLYNNKFFIVQSLLNVGVFLNVPDGIVRYIPHEFNLTFLGIALQNMSLMQLDITFNKQWGSYKTTNTNALYYTPTMLIPITTNSISPLLKTNNTIDWTIFDNINNFKTLLSLTSSADYFNDLIFEVAQAGDSLSIPILLVSE